MASKQTTTITPPPRAPPTLSEINSKWDLAVESWFSVCAGLSSTSITTVVNTFHKVNQFTASHLSELTPANHATLLLARRITFVAYCHIDTGAVAQGQALLTTAINLASSIPLTPETRTLLHQAIIEMKLTFDDDHDMSGSRQTIEKYGPLIDYNHPMQRPGTLLPNLKAAPFHNSTDFPFTTLLQDPTTFATIATEVGNISTTVWSPVGGGEHRDGGGTHDSSVLVGNWNEIVLFGTGAQPKLAPQTAAILHRVLPSDFVTLCSSGGGEVIVSKLGAGSRILPHCAPTNYRLTCHLGIHVPERRGGKECRIRVGEEWREWEVGKCMMFDDSFEHEVRNDSDYDRVILLIRFWHPDLKGGGEQGGGEQDEAVRKGVREKEEAFRERWVPPLDLTVASNRAVDEHLPIKGPGEDGAWMQGKSCGRSGGECEWKVRVVNGRLAIRCLCGRDRARADRSGEFCLQLKRAEEMKIREFVAKEGRGEAVSDFERRMIERHKRAKEKETNSKTTNTQTSTQSTQTNRTNTQS